MRRDVPLNLARHRAARGSRFRTPLYVLACSSLVVLLLAIGFILMFQIAYAGRIYPGVRALGHDLGGYSRGEAEAILRQSLESIAQRQYQVIYADSSWTLTAKELGLKAQLEPVLDSAYSIGREGNLVGRLMTQFGLWRQGRDFEQPGAAFDPVIQTALLQRLAREIDRPMVEAKLTIRSDFSVDLQPPQIGRRLNVEASRRRLSDALTALGADQIPLVVEEAVPKTVENNLGLAREQATQILSAPITLRYGDRSWTLERQQLASILRFDNRPGTSRAAYLDQPALEAWSRSLGEAVNQTAQDARFSWSGGKLEIIRPSRDGLQLDERATVEAILAAANGDHQEIPLPVRIQRPAVPMEDRHDLGIRGLLESARTPFAGSVPAKQDNITLASKRLNGVVVPPGGTFSFNRELGSTSLEAGFKTGWGITTAASGNVKTVPSVAGGICQVATTLFHTVFWTGFPIEERNWHLYWIPTYTSKGLLGLDATVDEEAGLDFQFSNPTKQHLLIQSWIDEGLNINFALYGTAPDWVVKVEPSVKADVIPAEADVIHVEEEPTMPEDNRLMVERAVEGFVVTNTRHVLRNGEEPRTLRLVSRYKPSRNVVLVGTGGKPASGRTVTEKMTPTPTLSPTAIPQPTAPARTTPPRATSVQAPVGPNPTPTTAPSRTPAAPATPTPRRR